MRKNVIWVIERGFGRKWVFDAFESRQSCRDACENYKLCWIAASFRIRRYEVGMGDRPKNLLWAVESEREDGSWQLIFSSVCLSKKEAEKRMRNEVKMGVGNFRVVWYAAVKGGKV